MMEGNAGPDSAGYLGLERWRVDRGTPGAAFALPTSQRFAPKTSGAHARKYARGATSVLFTGEADEKDPSSRATRTPYHETRNRFERLMEEWKQDTVVTPTIRQRILHPAYQQIIGMGEAVLPIIFEELQENPDHWFWALKAITGEDPVPEEAQGRFDVMVEAWVQWGRQQGFI